MAELTLLYDEGCAFCARVVRPFRSLDEVRVAPIGSGIGAELLSDLAVSDRYASVHLVDADGRRRSGADAIPPLLRRVRGGRQLAWLVERFPNAAAGLYGLVARNRMRLSRALGVPR